MKRKTLGLVLGGAALFAVKVMRSVRPEPLAGQSAVITGGSRGLGLVLARQLLAAGCSVTICARDAVELSQARDEFLAAWPTRLLCIACDIRDRAQVAQMVAVVRSRFGQIDIVINNAGVISVGPLETMQEEDYETSLQTHFWAPLHVIETVLPEMQARREGRIVNIASIGGKIAVPHLLPYCAGKFALVGLSEGLRSELAKDGISVTTVIPGLMRTGSPRHALFKGKHRQEYTWFHLSDALPLLSMGAERAGRQIIRAMLQRRAEVVLGIPAKLAVAFHGRFPGLTADILGLVNRVLPGFGGIGRQRRTGAESETAITQSFVTTLSRAAERRNNERVAGVDRSVTS